MLHYQPNPLRGRHCRWRKKGSNNEYLLQLLLFIFSHSFLITDASISQLDKEALIYRFCLSLRIFSFAENSSIKALCIEAGSFSTAIPCKENLLIKSDCAVVLVARMKRLAWRYACILLE